MTLPKLHHDHKDKPKFTPGPWRQHETGFKGSGNYNVTNASGQLYIAEVNAWSTDEESKANARLIAAAPDMYEALKELVAEVSGGGYETMADAIKRAEQAIDKAEGKEVGDE